MCVIVEQENITHSIMCVGGNYDSSHGVYMCV